MCLVQPLNSHIPPPLHDNNNGSLKKKEGKDKCQFAVKKLAKSIKVYLHVISDWVIYDSRCYCGNTEQSLGGENLCGERMCVRKCESERF